MYSVSTRHRWGGLPFVAVVSLWYYSLREEIIVSTVVFFLIIFWSLFSLKSCERFLFSILKDRRGVRKAGVGYEKKCGDDAQMTAALWGAGDLYREWILKMENPRVWREIWALTDKVFFLLAFMSGDHLDLRESVKEDSLVICSEPHHTSAALHGAISSWSFP